MKARHLSRHVVTDDSSFKVPTAEFLAIEFGRQARTDMHADMYVTRYMH